MNVPAFFDGLVDMLQTIRIPSNSKNEAALEGFLIPAIREYVSKQLATAQLQEIFYCHGDPNWGESKRYQNVAIQARNNSGDVLIRLPSGGSENTIWIDLKLTKRRKKKDGSYGSDSLTGGLQRAIGQAVIASLRHKYVVSFVAHWPTNRERDYDMTEELKKMLWKERRVRLILRPLHA